MSPKSLVLVPFCITQINLATTSAAQLISRSQSVSSPSATTLTQSVLLGNTTSPPLNQSQAQMYLRVSHRHHCQCPRGIMVSSLARTWAKVILFNHSYPPGLRQANLLLPCLCSVFTGSLHITLRSQVRRCSPYHWITLASDSLIFRPVAQVHKSWVFS